MKLTGSVVISIRVMISSVKCKNSFGFLTWLANSMCWFADNKASVIIYSMAFAAIVWRQLIFNGWVVHLPVL